MSACRRRPYGRVRGKIDFWVERLERPELVGDAHDTEPDARMRAGAGRSGTVWITASEGECPVAEVRAEMVANVWQVLVAQGDTVAEGDTLVILESMKMEIPVIVEDDGVIAELKVVEGDVIQEGDLIAVIE